MGPLHLERLWPKQADQCGLSYRDQTGARVVGQWLQDEKAFWRRVDATVEATKGAGGAVMPLPTHQVFLQIGGADRRLPGLARLVSRPSARLLVHQPERRGVVELPGDSSSGKSERRYAKVVRPDRVAGLAETMQRIQALATSFQVPLELEVDHTQGVVLMSALPGHSLYDLHGAEMTKAAQLAGVALRALHNIPLPAGVDRHGPDDEVEVLHKWLARLRLVRPDLYGVVHAQMEPTVTDLMAHEIPAVLLHRDFYDKQVCISEGGQVGLLDFDALTTGEAALDVANALVHLVLRAVQGRCSWEQARDAQAAFLAGYGIDRITLMRLQPYVNATRLRLICVYACRPAGRTVCGSLLNWHTQLDPDAYRSGRLPLETLLPCC